MKPTLAFFALATLLAAPGPCFALWELAPITKANAAEYDAEVRVTSAGPDGVRIELEFKTAGKLKEFNRVDLRVGGDNGITAALKEDRSKEGKVLVSFSTPRADLDKIQLWVMVPGGHGGIVYYVAVKEFVPPAK